MSNPCPIRNGMGSILYDGRRREEISVASSPVVVDVVVDERR